MTVIWRSFRLQLQIIRTNPDYFLALAIAPLATVVFVSFVRHAGQEDLVAFAVVAPALISLWRTSIMASGEIVNEDREHATMEPTIATPAAYATVVLGRILAVSAVGLVGFPVVWAVARLLFDVRLTASTGRSSC